MKRRLELVRGLLHAPRVLSLDEPTVGLDPQARAQMCDYMPRLAPKQGVCIFMTTHYMEEADASPSWPGEIVALDSPQGRKARTGDEVIAVDASAAPLAPDWAQRPGVTVFGQAPRFQVHCRDAGEVLGGVAAAFGPALERVEVRKPTLTRYFSNSRDARSGTRRSASRTPRRRRWGGAPPTAARGVYVIWLREILRFIREPARIISMLAQPLLYLLLVGNGISHGFCLDASSKVIYLAFMFPGIVGMSVLFTSMFGAVSIVWDREFGFLKEVLVSPVPRWAFAVGKAVGSSSVAVVQGAVLLLLAPAVGLHPGAAAFLGLVGVLLLVSLAITGLGHPHDQPHGLHAGLPDSAKLPGHASLLSQRRPLPPQGHARLAAGTHAGGSADLRNRCAAAPDVRVEPSRPADDPVRARTGPLGHGLGHGAAARRCELDVQPDPGGLARMWRAIWPR